MCVCVCIYADLPLYIVVGRGLKGRDFMANFEDKGPPARIEVCVLSFCFFQFWLNEISDTCSFLLFLFFFFFFLRLLKGKYAAMIVCWLLGNGCLFSWNSMLTIGDYYSYLFPVNQYLLFFNSNLFWLLEMFTWF